MEDKKGGGWRLQEGRWWCLIRSFVLLPLLWWALGFDSAAPVSSGIPLLPWQSHTYSHSSGILLNLCPANSQKMLTQAHMHHQRQTWIFDSKHAKMLSYTYWIPSLNHIYIQVHIFTHNLCTHYCLSCVSLKSCKPEAPTDLNADLCYNHLSANSSLCSPCV